jgi:hypothetical protein
MLASESLENHSGFVVDATGFAKCHPGGSAVIRGLAGKDASAAFRAVGHSAIAESQVTDLVIGVLQDAAAEGQTKTSSEASAREGRAHEFHTRRRLEMLAKYPEIQQLYGPDVWPWLYGPFCFVGFGFVGTWCGSDVHIPGSDYVLTKLSWWGIILAMWVVLPWLAFGLNNLNHEICHGNVRFLPRAAGGLVQLLAGCLTLNHFIFYYYYHSHLSHHQHLGKGDRGRAWRHLFAAAQPDAESAQRAEQAWDVDGDLYGMHPPLAVRESTRHVDSCPCPAPCACRIIMCPLSSSCFDVLLDAPTTRSAPEVQPDGMQDDSDIEERNLEWVRWYGDFDGLWCGLKVLVMSVHFSIMRFLQDGVMFVNGLCMSPCILSALCLERTGCLKALNQRHIPQHPDTELATAVTRSAVEHQKHPGAPQPEQSSTPLPPPAPMTSPTPTPTSFSPRSRGLSIARRPFESEMSASALLTVLSHILWIVLAGPLAWFACYISSFQQPCFIPLSLFYGYFAGIHAGYRDPETGNCQVCQPYIGCGGFEGRRERGC